MSGLTDRLREEKLRGIYGHIDRQRIEAADTIDALTAERDQLKREAALQRVSDFGQIQALTEERDALQDQCSRLTGEVTGMKRFRFEEAEKADARIAALRERVRELTTQAMFNA